MSIFGIRLLLNCTRPVRLVRTVSRYVTHCTLFARWLCCLSLPRVTRFNSHWLFTFWSQRAAPALNQQIKTDF